MYHFTKLASRVGTSSTLSLTQLLRWQKYWSVKPRPPCRQWLRAKWRRRRCGCARRCRVGTGRVSRRKGCSRRKVRILSRSYMLSPADTFSELADATFTVSGKFIGASCGDIRSSHVMIHRYTHSSSRTTSIRHVQHAGYPVLRPNYEAALQRAVSLQVSVEFR